MPPPPLVPYLSREYTPAEVAAEVAYETARREAWASFFLRNGQFDRARELGWRGVAGDRGEVKHPAGPSATGAPAPAMLPPAPYQSHAPAQTTPVTPLAYRGVQEAHEAAMTALQAAREARHAAALANEMMAQSDDDDRFHGLASLEPSPQDRMLTRALFAERQMRVAGEGMQARQAGNLPTEHLPMEHQPPLADTRIPQLRTPTATTPAAVPVTWPPSISQRV